jgi:hypothetical protein
VDQDGCDRGEQDEVEWCAPWTNLIVVPLGAGGIMVWKGKGGARDEGDSSQEDSG